MRKSAHREGTVGGPCHHIMANGYWCNGKAMKIVGRYGYCDRHAGAAMTYPPVDPAKAIR